MNKTMETKFVTDAAGTPKKVILDYDDYVKIAEQLNLSLVPTSTVKERNPLDWYSLTESANSILNGLMALASREGMLESEKLNPDQQRIAELDALRKDAVEQINTNDNFSSLEKMEAIIDKYSPILLAEKKKLRTSTSPL